MLSWIAANIGTIIVCAILGLVVAAVIVVMIRDKKKGKSPCGGSCRQCPMGGSCHNQ